MLQPHGWIKTFCLPTADGVTKAGLYGIKLAFGKDALHYGTKCNFVQSA